MNEQRLTITQVMNGWIVVLPYIHPMAHPANQEHAMRESIRIQKEAENSDPLVEKLTGKQNFEPVEIPVHQIKEMNVYTFKTFPEVLEFLEDKYIGTN